MNIDDEIKRFLDFWEKHQTEDMKVSGGLLRTPGCQGDHECCSKAFDLGGLADALKELTDDER